MDIISYKVLDLKNSLWLIFSMCLAAKHLVKFIFMQRDDA